ncbi:hypothetical protein [Streptomyces sp. Je 1-369]|uniref:hypothetical protein n=1 Tax=Streptomyces sp. Je 1-369 TaxID=2966192 RepID=UPI002286980B|nr:hypothetical protein [Streptomyces sp. Je 1-369]WAL99351.1 hypothetical protein NOO62_35680 [Streptomyces sp. Je 1-369]
MITDSHATPFLTAAVHNNADWCDAVCRSHGVEGTIEGGVWASALRTPPLYPDAVTLSPAATPDDVLPRIDLSSPGASVKDSFGTLDLSGTGFEVLFDAQWIYRAATDPAPPRAGDWEPVDGAGRLLAWEAAWSGAGESEGLFRPALLDAGAVFLTPAATGPVTAGAIAYPGAGAIGVSNLFATDDDLDDAWRSCLEATDRLWPGVPVVGYEHGDDLAAALRQGFEPVGPLRVWLRTDG